MTAGQKQLVDQAHQVVLQSGDRWLRLAWLLALGASLRNEGVVLEMAQGLLINIETAG